MGALIFGALLVLGGVLGLVFGIRVGISQRELVRTGLKAQGVIVDLEITDTSSRGQAQMTAYYPTFEFRGADGTLHRIRRSTGSSRQKAYRVGQTIEVIYLPGKENEAAMHSFAGVWTLPVLFCGMGVVMLLCGIVILKNNNRPNATLMSNPIVTRGAWHG